MSELKYHIQPLSVIVKPVDQPIFSELATTVCRVDEGAGMFVEVEQSGRTDLGKIAIDPAEWPVLRQAIDEMISGEKL